jgi:hypothetical protein
LFVLNDGCGQNPGNLPAAEGGDRPLRYLSWASALPSQWGGGGLQRKNAMRSR